MTSLLCGLKKTCDAKQGSPCRFTPDCSPTGVVDITYIKCVRNWGCSDSAKEILASLYSEEDK